MKPSTPFLAFLLSVLFTSAASEIILDVDGHPVQNDGKYYLFADGRAIINSTNDVVSALVYPGSPTNISTVINIARPTFVPTSFPVFLSFTPGSIWAVMPSSHVDKPIVSAKLTDPHWIRASFSFLVHDSEKFEYKLVYPEINGGFNNVVSRGNGEKFGEYENLVVTGNKNEAPAVFKFKKVEDDIGLSMVV